eukprot:259861-Pleurochrysis_carterae.AAC.1
MNFFSAKWSPSFPFYIFKSNFVSNSIRLQVLDHYYKIRFNRLTSQLGHVMLPHTRPYSAHPALRPCIVRGQQFYSLRPTSTGARETRHGTSSRKQPGGATNNSSSSLTVLFWNYARDGPQPVLWRPLKDGGDAN